MSKKTQSTDKKEKSWRRSLIEWGGLILIAAALYFTGYHTQVIGTAQRVLLETGLITPSLTIDYDQMADAGTEFYFAGEDHQTKSIANYRGKVVFLNIWASWCPPCIAEMPSISSLYDSYRDRDDVVFLLVSMDEDFEKARDFMEARDFDMPIYHYRGRDRTVFRSDLIPSTYVITPDGKIAMEKQGMAKYDTPEFKAFLDELSGDDAQGS